MLDNDTLYNPFNTAIKRKTISRPLRELINLGYFSLGDKVLDYGCGFGYDGNYLKLLLDRDKVFLYDEYNPIYKDTSLLERFYDKVVCFYVFNVISSLVEHERVLNLLKSLGKELFIAVRSDEIKSVKSSWEWDDNARGYWTTRNTFQRFYDEDMIKELFGEVEYIHKGKDYKLFKITVDK